MNKPFAWRKRWSRRILPILLVAWGLVSGCRADGPPDATAALPYAVEGVAEGLEAPWALAVAPDGRLFVTERPGRVRVIAEGKLMPEPLLSFSSPFVSEGEGGLLGIAVDPDFAHNGYLYVYHTYRAGEEVKNRVLRLAVRKSRAVVDRVLLDGIPGAVHHNGGRIHIGPDGCLYITTGDALRPELAQDLDSLAGKILRIHRDGSIPKDNPFPGSPVYSWGHRNPQGLAWHPVTGTLFSSEHGPSAHDELNRIEPGENYGWPLVKGDETRAAPVEAAYRGTPVRRPVTPPLLHSGTTTWAPSGMTFVTHGPWAGQLLVANLRGEQVLKLEGEGSDFQTVRSVTALFTRRFGRIRDVVEGPDGSLYLLTHNRDGRGTPRPGDDRIIRLTPVK